MNPNPDCKQDCRFVYGTSITTDMYYPPVYDKHGNNVNPDGNITRGSVKCWTCNTEWDYSTRYGKTSFIGKLM